MHTTQTPYFQKLTRTKSPRQIAFIFLDHLKKNHPIPEDIKVSVKFTSKSRNHGKINGHIVMNRTDRTAKITIYDAKTTETPALLSTLAHEYKHILQSFVESPEEWKGGEVFNIKNEVDACIFGQFKTRAFCYGEFYVLK